jgi:hypothetical protein
MRVMMVLMMRPGDDERRVQVVDEREAIAKT